MRISGEIKIITGAALFAFIPVCVVLGKDLSVFALLFGRLLLASIVLFLLHKNKRLLFRITGKQLFKLFTWSQLMLAGMICYFFAIKYSNIAISSALLGTQPVVIVILAAILLRQKVSKLSLFASVITLLGIVFITGFDGIFNKDFFLGELLAIASAIFLALNFILQKKYLSEYSGKQLVLFQGFFQLPLLLPFIFYSPGTITIPAIASILILGIICTVVAYTLIYEGVRTVDAQKIGVLQSIEFVLPIIIGVLFYKETPSANVLFGMILIIGACILVSILPSNKKRK